MLCLETSARRWAWRAGRTGRSVDAVCAPRPSPHARAAVVPLADCLWQHSDSSNWGTAAVNWNEAVWSHPRARSSQAEGRRRPPTGGHTWVPAVRDHALAGGQEGGRGGGGGDGGIWGESFIPKIKMHELAGGVPAATFCRHPGAGGARWFVPAAPPPKRARPNPDTAPLPKRAAQGARGAARSPHLPHTHTHTPAGRHWARRGQRGELPAPRPTCSSQLPVASLHIVVGEGLLGVVVLDLAEERKRACGGSTAGHMSDCCARWG
jgi:hypothetical protein